MAKQRSASDAEGQPGSRVTKASEATNIHSFPRAYAGLLQSLRGDAVYSWTKSTRSLFAGLQLIFKVDGNTWTCVNIRELLAPETFRQSNKGVAAPSRAARILLMANNSLAVAESSEALQGIEGLRRGPAATKFGRLTS